MKIKKGFTLFTLNESEGRNEVTNGFTLIEILLTIGVIGLVLPVLFTTTFGIFKAQTKIGVLNEVKKQGDYALNVMENLIRNSAGGTYNGSSPIPGARICDTSTASPVVAKYFVDKSDAVAWFRFYLNNDAISSQSAILNNGSVGEVNLTTSKVKVTSLSLTCANRSSFSGPVISISFQVQYNTTSTNPEDTAVLNYQTKVKLREFF